MKMESSPSLAIGILPRGTISTNLVTALHEAQCFQPKRREEVETEVVRQRE